MKKQMIVLTRRVLPMVLAVLLTSTVAFATQGEEQGSGFSNFTKKQEYEHGRFSDVTEKNWFAPGVQSVIELGLMSGKTASSFAPNEQVKLCEAISMAAKTRHIYNGGNGNLDSAPGAAAWYRGAVDYAISQNMIKMNDFPNYEAYATRAQLAYIFSGAVPQNRLAPINAIASVPDVSEDTAYADDILALYRAGVVSGSDASGTYNPDEYIIRGEAASILSRVAVPSLRQSFVLKPSAPGTVEDPDKTTPSAVVAVFSEKENTFHVTASTLWIPAPPMTGASNRLDLLLKDKPSVKGKAAKDAVTAGELIAYVALRQDAAAPLSIFHNLTVASVTKEISGQSQVPGVHLTLPDGSNAYFSSLLSSNEENARYWILTAEDDNRFITLVGRCFNSQPMEMQNEMITAMKSLTLSGITVPVTE